MRLSKYQQPGSILESSADAALELQKVLATAPASLSAFSDGEASLPLIAGKWSRKQILGHLIDSAANNHHRFVRAQIEKSSEKSFEMPGYAQNEWVATNAYQQRNWNDLVTFWTSYNQHILHLILTARIEHLTIPCKVAGDESGSLEFLMIDYVAHLQHHLHQILATR